MTTTLTVKNGVIYLPNQIGKRLENKTVRLIDNGLTISITTMPLSESDLSADKPKQDIKALKIALKNAIGVFPKNQDGLKFTKKIRGSWDTRLNKIYGRI